MVEDLEEVVDREDECGFAVCCEKAAPHESPEAPVLLGPSDRLRHVNTLLSTQVRLLVPTSPLSGQVVTAERVVRRNGIIWLTVVVADGTTRSVELEKTDLLGEVPGYLGQRTITLDAEALRGLKRLVELLSDRQSARRRPRACAGSRHNQAGPAVTGVVTTWYLHAWLCSAMSATVAVSPACSGRTPSLFLLPVLALERFSMAV